MSLENSDKKEVQIIAQTKLDGVELLTVFVAHRPQSKEGHEPMLYETRLITPEFCSVLGIYRENADAQEAHRTIYSNIIFLREEILRIESGGPIGRLLAINNKPGFSGTVTYRPKLDWQIE